MEQEEVGVKERRIFVISICVVAGRVCIFGISPVKRARSLKY
jgi:hypothetical protein